MTNVFDETICSRVTNKGQIKDPWEVFLKHPMAVRGQPVRLTEETVPTGRVA